VKIARKGIFKERPHNSHPCEFARNGFIQEIKKWNSQAIVFARNRICKEWTLQIPILANSIPYKFHSLQFPLLAYSSLSFLPFAFPCKFTSLQSEATHPSVHT